jgi:microcompartment protein CcmK/EutM
MLDLPFPLRVTVVALVTATCVLLVTVSPDLALPAHAHELLLLGHLAALALGLGAVLAIDWHGLLWLLRRIDLPELLTVTSRLTTPVWMGLTGLVVTGALLSPDTDAPLTRLKLLLVGLVTFNGLHAGAVHSALLRAGAGTLPRRLLARGLAVGAVSQVGWWGATVIGLLNTT